MAATLRIERVDREFFGLVAEAAFCNPFSEERMALDERIVGRPIRPFSEEHLEGMTALVTQRLEKLEKQGAAELRRYRPEDRELMRTVYLFDIYHRFCRDFDGLIEEQIQAGESVVPVPFASEVLGQLRRRGLAEEESVRFLSIFYQLRRAYHFIVHGLVGLSPCMREFRRHLWNDVFTHDVRVYDRYLWNRMEDFSTLLLGETGTGKGTAAAAIGRSGYIPFEPARNRFAESFTRNFIALNLAQYPEALIESELFGHRKGAFTGAIEAHEGVLARCSPHGAIFLDEIGEVSEPIQIKLLQVLHERTFCPVGSHDPIRFRGRVIAATNRALEALRGEGLFRDDFFYRLCSDIIWVPPLRQRLQEAPDELSQLVEHVVTGLVGHPASELVELVQTALDRHLGPAYPWPGNVRELEQAVRRILLTRQYAASRNSSGPDLRAELIAGLESGSLDADGLLAGYCALLYQRTPNYEAVARRVRLDRRTVKKYVQQGLG